MSFPEKSRFRLRFLKDLQKYQVISAGGYKMILIRPYKNLQKNVILFPVT